MQPLVFHLSYNLALPGNIHMHKNVLNGLNYVFFIADKHG